MYADGKSPVFSLVVIVRQYSAELSLTDVGPGGVCSRESGLPTDHDSIDMMRLPSAHLARMIREADGEQEEIYDAYLAIYPRRGGGVSNNVKRGGQGRTGEMLMLDAWEGSVKGKGLLMSKRTRA